MAMRNKKSKLDRKPTRKQLRKEKRKDKKKNRNEFHMKKYKTQKEAMCQEKEFKEKNVINRGCTIENLINKEKKQTNKLIKEMNKHRVKLLQHANVDEDKNIKKLEKQLKLNKGKTKSIPKSFSEDGLDYLLEICDSETMNSAVALDGESDDDNIFKMIEDIGSEEEGVPKKSKKRRKEVNDVKTSKKKFKKETNPELHSLDEDNSDSENQFSENYLDSELDEEQGKKGLVKMNEDGTWEDIYGRLRDKDGTIMNKCNKYVPPSIKAKLESNLPEDKTRTEKLSRLKKQIKGLLNRLAESNMHNIASQIENLYMNNSRNDMNETLTNLITDSLVSEVITPERLLIEHVVLIIILHANVGTEVGAHFLQTIIRKFDEFVYSNHDVENKMLDNVISIISQLYNFKLYDSKLIYDVLNKLTSKFQEKEVEGILHILKSIGFTLRKDDPIALKNFILDVQKKASNATEEVKDNPRVKFMLEVLLAIKNNNVTKIPNYDTSYPEHLKKVMKAFIRKGNYVTQLNISLEDLLKADERGKWWVVGSAWRGNVLQETEKTDKPVKADGYSAKLLALAKKQRMNTDIRRNIFCIIMSSEDYLDAFEKLLQLGLRNQQEKEIINVILHCCINEKKFNPFYAFLSRKFCEYDRKYQLSIKCSVWDKLKSLSEHSGNQLSHLAKLLTHLFLEKGLPISTLKIVEFGELDKITLRFMRQILLGILLTKDTEDCLSVFEKVAKAEKLKLFRESLRLFIHHFLLRNLKSESISDEQKSLLETRAKLVEKVLVSKENRIRF